MLRQTMGNVIKNITRVQIVVVVAAVIIIIIMFSTTRVGTAVAQLVEALRYKSEGRGFDSRWCHWNPSGRTMALGSTQPLREMSTRNISCG